MFSMFSEMSEFVGGYTDPMLEMTAEESEALDNAPEADYSSLDIEESFSQMALENERNFNNIMMSTMVQEATYFAQYGREMVYEGDTLKNFWQKIKDFFKKAWEKIKSIFNKVVAWISSVIRSDKAYLDKYADKIKKADGRTISVKGYTDYVEFEKTEAKNTVAAITAIIGVVNSNMNKTINHINDTKEYSQNITNFTDDMKKDDIKKDFWAKISDKTKSVPKTATSSEEFQKTLNKKIDDANGTITTVNATAVITIIRDAKMSKSAIKDAYAGAKKCINGFIKLSEGYEKACKISEREDDTPDNKSDKKAASKISGNFSIFAKEGITCLNILYKSVVKMINKSYSTAKAVARAAVNLKDEDKDDKKDSKNESFMGWSDTFLV